MADRRRIIKAEMDIDLVLSRNSAMKVQSLATFLTMYPPSVLLLSVVLAYLQDIRLCSKDSLLIIGLVCIIRVGTKEDDRMESRERA